MDDLLAVRQQLWTTKLVGLERATKALAQHERSAVPANLVKDLVTFALKSSNVPCHPDDFPTLLH
jgi:hypothetical protein